MRKLSPTRFRYRILDANNQVISGRSTDAPQVDTNRTADHRCDSSSIEPTENTRVYSEDHVREVAAEYTRIRSNGTIHKCASDYTDKYIEINQSTVPNTDHYSTMRYGEPIRKGYRRDETNYHAPAFTCETPPNYAMRA